MLNPGSIEPVFARAEIPQTARTTRPRIHRDHMCNLYYADFWIMPTIGSGRALTVAIAALESA